MQTLVRRFLLLPLLLAAGCSTTDVRAPTDADLLKRARAPETLGVVVTHRADGAVVFDEASVLSGADTVHLPLYARLAQHVRMPLVRVRLNGKTTYALVDTGAATTVVDIWAALRTQVAPLGPPLMKRRVFTPAGPADLTVAIAARIELGGSLFERVPVGISPADGSSSLMAWIDGYRVEMVIGQDLLSRFSQAIFDYENERLDLGPVPPPKRPRAVIARAPLSLRFGLPVFSAELDGKPLHVALDTGLLGGLWIPRPEANRLALPELDERPGLQMGHALGGRTVYRAGAPRALRLLEGSLPPLPLLVSLVNQGESDAPYALAGSELFQRVVVVIDYAGREIRFERP